MDGRVHRRVLASHRDTVSAICDAGEEVAASWPDTTVSDANRITDPLGQSILDPAPEQCLSVRLTGAD